MYGHELYQGNKWEKQTKSGAPILTPSYISGPKLRHQHSFSATKIS